MELYEYQREVARHMRQGKSIILQAPTGAGKTMAALWPFLQNWAANENRLPRKCVYAVPMRVLANQFDADYNKTVNEDMLIAFPPEIKRQTGEYKEDAEFRADMTFATIDQVLSGWLMAPYSLPRRRKGWFARLLSWHPQKVERELAYLHEDDYLLVEDDHGRI